MSNPKRILILGGTAEARRLADHLATDARFDIETSLAGVTANPSKPAGRMRQGGFGGAAGLASYLRASHIDMLIDATHPFADTISRHAAEASSSAGCERIVVRRPEWHRQAGDTWIEVNDVLEAAARAPTAGTRAFLTIGRQEISAFEACTNMWFLVRLIDPPSKPFAGPAHRIVAARGPFTQDSEIGLLESNRIDLIVTKNSGGGDTYAKIAAARMLGLPVLMIRRPPPPPGPISPTVEDAVARLETLAI